MGETSDSVDDGLQRVCAAVQHGPSKTVGGLDGNLREQVFRYATASARGDAVQPSADALPAEVRAFADAVLTKAVDADVAGLQKSGRTDDFIYELAVVAAVAAGSQRALIGLEVLRASRGGP